MGSVSFGKMLLLRERLVVEARSCGMITDTSDGGAVDVVVSKLFDNFKQSLKGSVTGGGSEHAVSSESVDEDSNVRQICSRLDLVVKIGKHRAEGVKSSVVLGGLLSEYNKMKLETRGSEAVEGEMEKSLLSSELALDVEALLAANTMLQALNDAAEHVQSEATFVSIKIEGVVEEIADVQQEIESLTVEIMSLKQELHLLQADSKEGKSRVIELDKNIRAIKEKISKLQLEEGSAGELESLADQLKDLINSKKEEVVKLDGSYKAWKKVEARIEEKHAKTKELIETLCKLEDPNLERGFDELQGQIDDFAFTVGEELSKHSRELNGKVRQLKDKAKLESQSKELSEDKLKELIKESEDLNKEVVGIYEKYAINQPLVDNLKEALEAYK